LYWANAWLPANFRGNALIFFFCQARLSSLTMIFPTSCRTQCPPLKLGQLLTMLQAQFLLWDLIPQPWLSWCQDMPHQTQSLSVQLLIREKLHLWLPLQLPRRKELPKEFLLR
jgi:hypothetical protein